MFVRYAEVGALPVGATVRAVRSNLKRRRRISRSPVLALSVLVLVAALTTELIAFLPRQASQAFSYGPAVQIAPIRVDTAPLDVGLSPDDRLSASNSLAPSVAVYRWRPHRFHHARSAPFADGWSYDSPKDEVDASAQLTEGRDGLAEQQMVGDSASGADLREPLRR